MSLVGILSLLKENVPAYTQVRQALQTPGSTGSTISVAVGALYSPAKPYFWTALLTDLNRPTLVVLPRQDEANTIYTLLQAYAAPGTPIYYWPAADTIPYERLSPDPSEVGQRLLVLNALTNLPPAGQPQPVIVTCARGLAFPTLATADLLAYTTLVKVGQRLDLNALLGKWVNAGYQPVSICEEPGTFSRRGGIIDIFPRAALYPVRIDLFDDEVDSLRLFDPVTQRSEDKITQVVIGPPNEIPFWRSGEAVARMKGTDLKGVRPEAQEEWAQHISNIENAEPFDGMELYFPYFSDRLHTLLDHLPPQTLLLLDESPQIHQALVEMDLQARELREQFSASGELPRSLPLPYLTWPQIAEFLQNYNRLDTFKNELDDISTLPSGAAAIYPPELPGWETIVNFPLFQPAPAFASQLDRLIATTREEMQGGRRVIIVSQQCQRLTELFEDADIYPTMRKGNTAGNGTTSPAAKGPGKKEGLILPDNPRLHDLTELLSESITTTPSYGSLNLVQGSLSEGWLSETISLNLYTDVEIFGWARPQRRAVQARKPKTKHQELFIGDLELGSYVVHIEHGIGRYDGLIKMKFAGGEREYLLIRYREADKLYVPIDQVDRLMPYVGVGEAKPQLNKLGTAEWARAKKKVKSNVEDLAKELIALYGSRETAKGFAFSPDTQWQLELEGAFPYEETPDQLTAIAAVKKDMEGIKPMDRLVCGDVGYGKTEVALRGVFKAVQDNKQVAILVPTTILAQQHYRTLHDRLSAYPVVVEVISRFRTKKEQDDILLRLAAGTVDIIVGTHRLLQKDIKFKDLGLVVVDEEQRFGVKHKERLKQMRHEVDVLTLTATPIPRTLHMALVGVRDMSVIETPPEQRLPIKTYVTHYKDELVREVIIRELDRGGQVYLVHNRVENIDALAYKMKTLVPEARFIVGHGQMGEGQLEKMMEQFVCHEADVLICTTIIESGLDIPNVNTLIVNEANHFGLAQLYQIRGRVGRGTNRAYAYFLYSEGKILSDVAQKRLTTIQQATELGAGFRIAMKDLEIRGAGNLLGPEQHGNVATVGFDLYCRLLTQAVEQSRGETVEEEPLPISIDLPLKAYLPEEYISDGSLRIKLYQRLTQPLATNEVNDIVKELGDRFGPLPAETNNLIYILSLKPLARRAHVEGIATNDEGIITIKLRRGDRFDRRQAQKRFGEELLLSPTQLRFNSHRIGTPKWLDYLKELLTFLSKSTEEHEDRLHAHLSSLLTKQAEAAQREGTDEATGKSTIAPPAPAPSKESSRVQGEIVKNPFRNKENQAATQARDAAEYRAMKAALERPEPTRRIVKRDNNDDDDW